jgi:hypothetical protein
VLACERDTDSWIVCAEGKTTPDGSARLSGLDPGKGYRLVVRLGEEFDVITDDWRPADTVVTAPASRTVTGRVVGAGRNGDFPGTVWFLPASSDEWSCVECDEAGRFEIGPVPAEPIRLIASTADAPWAGDSRIVVLPPGRDRVDLPYRAGATLRLRITNLTDEMDPEGCLSDARGEVVEYIYGMEDGVLEFEDLDPEGTFSLWIGPTEKGLALHRAGLRPGAGEVAVTLVPAGAVRGRLVVPAGATEVEVCGRGPGLDLWGSLFPDGRFEVWGVPPGARITVVAEGRLGHRSLRAEVPASAGDTLEITLEDE